MLTRSLLTTIIGFLIGCILYLIIAPYTTFIFLLGGLGYVIGLILDNSDRKREIETFHFSSIPSTHEIFHCSEVPEAVVIYSAHDNTTSVLLDYKIEAKPENYRLSVLKNLQEFDFRIIEDTSQTIFSLCIEYPEFHYPSLKEIQHRMSEFYYDIKERSNDFQGAIQKLIPGIVITVVQNPDILGNEILNSNNFSSTPPSSFFPSSPSNNYEDRSFDSERNAEVVTSLSEENENSEYEATQTRTPEEDVIEDHSVKTKEIDVQEILEDLNQTPATGHTCLEDSPELPPIGTEDRVNRKKAGNTSENTSKLKKVSFLTAKEIEENQNHILTKETTVTTQAGPDESFKEFEKEKESQQSILDYSSVSKSSSMPLDEEGEGIFNKINEEVIKIQKQQSKNPEKVPTENG